jgi:hypothetical protein
MLAPGKHIHFKFAARSTTLRMTEVPETLSF